MANDYPNNRQVIMGVNTDGENKNITVNYNGVLQVNSNILVGSATGGSTTTLIDTTKNFETDIIKDKIAKIYIASKEYLRKITANTVDTITFPAIQAATPATATVSVAEAFDITVVCASAGSDGNDYSISIVEAPGSDDNLSASLSEGVVTVYLGKTSGTVDDAKNTAELVAAEIDKISEFTASVTSGSGVVVVTEEDIPFTGGLDGISVVAGTEYAIL